MSTTKPTPTDEYFEKEKKRIEENYTSGIATLDKNKAAAQEVAAVTRERLLKYLPGQLKAQGIHTQGISEDATIKALNNYQNTMSGISQSYDAGVAAMNNEKNDRMSELEKTVLQQNENERNSHLNAYTTLFSNAKSGTYSAEQVSDLARAYGGFSDEEINSLVGAAVENYFNSNTESAAAGGVLANETANAITEYLSTYKGAIGDDAYQKYLDAMSGVTVASPDATEEEYKTLMSEHNVKPDGSVFDTKTATAENIVGTLDVAQGEKQTEHVRNILAESKYWGADKNGTVVDFNYGQKLGSNKGNIFVFYNGKWYQTTRMDSSYEKAASDVVDFLLKILGKK